MATETKPGPFGEVRSPSTAAGGTALSTTAAFIGFPEGTRYVTLITRNFSTAVVAQVGFCPYLFVLKTTDDLAAAGNLTDYSSQAQDDDTSTVVDLSSFAPAAALDFLYVGSLVPFAGVDCDVIETSAGGGAVVLTVKYWNGSAWADISDTDGTTTGGKAFGQDGVVSWTVPTAWTADSLVDIGDATTAIGPHVGTQGVYWTRWEVSTELDTSVTLGHMLAVPRWTDSMEMIEGQALEGSVSMGFGKGSVAGVRATTNAGTGNLIVNVATAAAGKEFA